MAEGDAAFGEIVRGKLKRYLVARQYADAIAAQTPRQMRQDYAVVVDLNTEFAARKLLQNGARNFNIVFFAHKPPRGIS